MHGPLQAVHVDTTGFKHSPQHRQCTCSKSAAEEGLGVWGERPGTCTSVQGQTSPPSHWGEQETGALASGHLPPLHSELRLLTAGGQGPSWWEASAGVETANSAYKHMTEWLDNVERLH